MGRKRSGSTKKGRSRKGSSNNSRTATPASTTPASTSFSESAAGSTVSESSAYATPEPSSPVVNKDTVGRLNKDDTENTPKEKESSSQAEMDEENADTGATDRISGSDKFKDAENGDNDQYDMGISLQSEAEAPSSEDQLDDLYIRTPRDTEGDRQAIAAGVSTKRPKSPSVAIEGDESFVPTAKITEATANSNTDEQRSVNMEDSQAELLLSNLDDSMYRSAVKSMGSSANDEVHSLESSAAHRHSDGDDFEYNSAKNLESERLNDSITRSYVITPGAFADEDESEVVTHIRHGTSKHQPAAAQDISGSSMTDSYIHVADRNESARSSKVAQPTKEIMDNAKDSAKNAADKVDKAASDAKNAASDAASKAADKSKEAANSVADAAHDASSRAKEILDSASKSVKDAAANANEKAHDAINKARESGERFAKKAREEANEAEKAVKKHADETPLVTLKVMGIVAAALAVVSGYHYRLPGGQNQRIGFAGAVASAIIGLGTLATAFIRRNNN
ncbi:hypothetical protein EV175_000964 [Coemansia sp. RSA 1933]|nr:hypothetical protein EV175_000964 [Coemansia sp. RSA 1933]